MRLIGGDYRLPAAIFDWRYALQLPKHAYEVLRILEADLTADHVDLLIRAFQELTGFGDPQLLQILNEALPGIFLESHAKV